MTFDAREGGTDRRAYAGALLQQLALATADLGRTAVVDRLYQLDDPAVLLR